VKGAWLTMKRRPGFTRRAVNDHFSTSAASTAAPNGCRRSLAPPANPIYLCACHAAQGRARPGTSGMTLGTSCADLCSSRRIRELPSPTYSVVKRQRRCGASAARAEKRTSGAGLTMPGFVGVVRTDVCESESAGGRSPPRGASLRPRLGPDEFGSRRSAASCQRLGAMRAARDVSSKNGLEASRSAEAPLSSQARRNTW
jgi:hypothetical protein